MTVANTIAVRPLDITDLDAAACLFAEALDRDAMANLLCPDRTDRLRFQERGGRKQIHMAMRHRHVFGAYDREALRGLAVWLPPGVSTSPVGAAPPMRCLPRVMAAVARDPRSAVRLMAGRQRAISQAHASPAWHLAFLATAPAHQGRGIGRRLLDHVLRRADADGAPVWLETSDPANVPLYERFGFEVTARVHTSARLPTFWVMVRPPGRDADAPPA
jgi:ribosomal protein S18 acetylase RimI-like enzyme